MSNKKWYCKKSTEDELGRVGIEFKNEYINIYFPHGYRLPKEEDINAQREAVIDLLNTMSLTKDIDEKGYLREKNGDISGFPVNSYLWLLNDYINNGLFNIREKVYIQSQKGKINWKRTFSTTPIFSEQGAVYLNPYVEKNTKIDNIITEIHAYCINDCIEQIGWLFGNIEKVDYKILNFNKELYLNVLNEELKKTFNDRVKTMLNNMIVIIKNKFNNNKTEMIDDILTLNYHYAWEKMIDKVYGNDSIENYRPELSWNNLPEKVPNPHMRPDTINIDKSKRELFIIDSKYYKYGIIRGGKLPGAEDIDKQITYGDYCSDSKNFIEPIEYDTDKIYNAFILPYNKEDNRFNYCDNVKFIGFAESKARTGRERITHKRVALILMDTKYLIDCYLLKQNKKCNELLDSIRCVLKNK